VVKKKSNQLTKIKLKTNNLRLDNKKKELELKGVDKEVKIIELKIMNLGIR